jgi:hypothetical protein
MRPNGRERRWRGRTSHDSTCNCIDCTRILCRCKTCTGLL